MRTLLALVALATLVVHPPAHAQDPGETQSARADLQAERTKVVADNLQLTEAEAAKFWPLYNEYRAKHSKIGDQAIALINDFAANYDALSDEKAKDLVKRQLDIDEDRLKLQRSYLGKLEKAIPPKKVARFYQIERKLDAMVTFEAARSIPLAQ
jgi:Spy/CpxP family protein refolding chaperone